MTAHQIKNRIVTALEECGVFDSVTTPPDDRKGNSIMREPAAAVFLERLRQTEENGLRLLTADFSVYMKFLRIGVNDTAEDIEAAVAAIASLEPAGLSQKMITDGNSRSAVYLAEVSFTGCM